jgi:hypothetical protein
MPRLKLQGRRLCVANRKLVCGCGGTTDPCCAAANSVFKMPAAGGFKSIDIDISVSATISVTGWAYPSGQTYVAAPPLNATMSAATSLPANSTVPAAQCGASKAVQAKVVPVINGGWEAQTPNTTFAVDVPGRVNVGAGVYAGSGIDASAFVQTLYGNEGPPVWAPVLLDTGYTAAKYVAKAGASFAPASSYQAASGQNTLQVFYPAVEAWFDSDGHVKVVAYPGLTAQPDYVLTGSATAIAAVTGTYAPSVSYTVTYRGAPSQSDDPTIVTTGQIALTTNLVGCKEAADPPPSAQACAYILRDGYGANVPATPPPSSPLPLVEPTDNPLDMGAFHLP